MTNKTIKFNDMVAKYAKEDPTFLEDVRQEQFNLLVASALKEARTEKAWTQKELATKVNSSQKTISNIERGDNVSFAKQWGKN